MGTSSPAWTCPRTCLRRSRSKLRLSLDGKVVAERPLVALAEVAEGGFFKRMNDDFWLWWESE